MGYEVTIGRKNDWNNDEEDYNISFQEWLDYVKTDSELKLTNGYEMKLPGKTPFWQECPGYCIWTGHSKGKSENYIWLAYSHGGISAKYPDDETLSKMLRIARELNAKVQGDDGEFYDKEYFERKKNKPESQVLKNIGKP